MFPNSSGVLFFGAKGKKPVKWSAVTLIPELTMDESNVTEEQSKVFATIRDSSTFSFNYTINKNSIKNLIELTRGFKLTKGPERKRMIQRAKKMQTNYICTYTFRKEGDEYVDERGQVRLVLQ